VYQHTQLIFPTCGSEEKQNTNTHVNTVKKNNKQEKSKEKA